MNPLKTSRNFKEPPLLNISVNGFHFCFGNLGSYYRLMHEKRDKGISRIFFSKKFRKWFNYFTCILPNYLTNKSQKEFWKNNHFENTRAGFLLRCQNPLRQNTSKIMHFQIWKNKNFIPYFVVAYDMIKIYTH